MDTPEMSGFHSTLPNMDLSCIKGSLMKTACFSASASKRVDVISVEDYLATLGYQFNH